MATISNLYIDQGSTFTSILTVKDGNGALLDLTDFTAKSQIRKSYGSSTAYNFNAEIFGTPADGQIRLILTPAQTEAISPGRYLYDVEITNTDTLEKIRVVEGLAIVTPQITQI